RCSRARPAYASARHCSDPAPSLLAQTRRERVWSTEGRPEGCRPWTDGTKVACGPNGPALLRTMAAFQPAKSVVFAGCSELPSGRFAAKSIFSSLNAAGPARAVGTIAPE